MDVPVASQVPSTTSSTERVEEDATDPSPVAAWVDRPDFPKCALGQRLNIGGYIGTVVAVVNQSLKVRSAEGTTRSFNAHGLRRIYGPRIVVEPQPSRIPPEAAAVDGGAPGAEPTPEEAGPPAIEPDFGQPLKSVVDLVGCSDFPANTLGQFVDFGGYSGVVVQIVRQSLKVRSPAGFTRSYNTLALRKLHGIR